MLQLEAANLIAAVGYLAGSVSDWRVQIQLINNEVCPPLYLPKEHRIHFLKSLERLRDAARELEMVATKGAAERAFDDCLQWFAAEQRYSSVALQKVISHADRVVHAFGDEMRSRLVFVMPSKHAAFYSDRPMFGEEVDDAFPSAGPDIAEASKCRALGRWTACVMHLMRVLEIGLGVLAKQSDVEPNENWNTMLNQIETALRSINRKTEGREAEQWAAEAGTHLRFIKNAWRNHAMHVHERYDEERAIAIYENTRTFMRHLAAKAAE